MSLHGLFERTGEHQWRAGFEVILDKECGVLSAFLSIVGVFAFCE